MYHVAMNERGRYGSNGSNGYYAMHASRASVPVSGVASDQVSSALDLGSFVLWALAGALTGRAVSSPEDRSAGATIGMAGGMFLSSILESTRALKRIAAKP